MKRVLFVNVTDSEYPRHRALAHVLESSDYQVCVVKRPQNVGYLRRCYMLLTQGFRFGPVDVVISGEFANSYVWTTWILARFRSALHVVDGFIGMYETHVEDTGSAQHGSLRARAYKLVDHFAFRTADLYLVDTYARKLAVIDRYQHRWRDTKVYVLPVGAPSWAQPSPMPDVRDEIRFLYYGNYIPLHGLDRFISALADLPGWFKWSARIVGPSVLAEPYRLMTLKYGLSDQVEFMDSVPTDQLSKFITECHVVVGIFGDSPKALSVIANKVWQGLAAERFVLTQSSIGTKEIESLFDRSLLLPSSIAPHSITEFMVKHLPDRLKLGPTPHARKLVDDYLDRHFDDFLHELGATKIS